MVWDGTEHRQEILSELERFKIYERFKKQDQRIINIESQNETIFKKLDQLLLARSDDAKEIQRIKSAVENGLSKDLQTTTSVVSKLNETIEEMCKGFEDRLKEVEKGSWFIIWINDLRDGTFKKAIKYTLTTIIFFVGIILGIIYFGYNYMKNGK